MTSTGGEGGVDLYPVLNILCHLSIAISDQNWSQRAQMTSTGGEGGVDLYLVLNILCHLSLAVSDQDWSQRADENCAASVSAVMDQERFMSGA